ncbi:glycerate kinase [Brachyspira hampsonii]|uniref:Glycerate kinase n=1 Tax=Brachyspira hampsonii TaxID=1287055 RepID=A0AAC9TV63_9SPIR|nr:glycerate kinase [Brachyspira hampsonii]ASJ21829.1 glycerate kinase [Brachyspira hampsonii]ELV06416.1 glycerate kinase [Brachyspira hampsonii 30599]MBW5380813.1 glycerate kinase [Brachyspira hampsonii]OEJ15047.1 glycerate kinase [Brachyspira hampsonii]
MKKIIIIPDSFKGSAGSLEICNYIEKGVLKVIKDADTIKIPVADGGEGTVESILYAAGGNIKKINVRNPKGDIIEAKYGIINEYKAVIEMAEASGLTLINDKKREPLKYSTYGTGELIKDALNNNIKEILIGIGGSATNDCGIGMANALGYKFLDKNNNELEAIAENMIKTEYIDNSNVDKRIFDIKITAACDVKNPLYGENGATAVYGKQKGVTNETFDILDNGLKNIAKIIKEKFGKEIDYMEGAGAAGGLGGGLVAFCNAKLKSGIDAVLDIIDFESKIKDASLIITGEGAIDGQTKEGKVPVGVAKRAGNIPVIAIVGEIREGAEIVYDLGIKSIMPLCTKAMTLDESISNTAVLVENAAERALRFINIELK